MYDSSPTQALQTTSGSWRVSCAAVETLSSQDFACAMQALLDP